MVTTIRDFLPFGDVGPELLHRVASERPGLPVEDLAAVFALGKAAVSMFDLIAEPLGEVGLSPARWRLLMTLRFQSIPEGASIGEIADHLEIREPTVTSTVDRAVRDGLVERRKDPNDRRVTRVALTSAGHDMIERMFPQVLGRFMSFSAAMGGPESINEIAAQLENSVRAAAPAERNR